MKEESAIVESKPQNEVVSFEGTVPFATNADAATNTGVAKAILAAPKLNFNTQAETWSPEEVGERKRMIFQGVIEDAKTKNKFRLNETDPEFVFIDKAVFVEVYLDEKEEVQQRVIETYATTIISYLQSNKVPRHAILDIEFNGEKKGDTFKYHTFKIIPVPVEFS